MSLNKSKCLRISGIPDEWSEDNLLQCLETLDPHVRDNEFEISLYPACHGSGQVGMLNLSQCTEYFKQVVPYKPFVARAQGQDLSIDCDFNGLTPLNTPPKSISADIVAVTGLAGHPYGSWKSRQSHRMWLQDFLPRDLRGARIMTFGYDSRIEVNKGRSRMLDYARFFVDQLYIARSSKSVWVRVFWIHYLTSAPQAQSRPIVFIGHSLGGILIIQVALSAMAREREILI
ncbi:16090_t:CDS:2, partial [Acaulospora colombiana]